MSSSHGLPEEPGHGSVAPPAQAGISHSRENSAPTHFHRHSTAHAAPIGPPDAGVSSGSDFQTATLTRRRPGPPTSMHRVGGPASSDHCSEMDLTTYSNHHHHHHMMSHQASIHSVPANRSHELRRPDSVITTSSIVSSDTASQAGDSSTEVGLHGPPSIYMNSGLYGGAGAGCGDRERGSSSGSSTAGSIPVVAPSKPSEIASSSLANDLILSNSANASLGLAAATAAAVKKTKTLPAQGTAPPTADQMVMTHRRQTSHPGNFNPVPVTTNSSPPEAATSTAAPVITVSHASSSCHRRSNSYGHHRALTGTVSCGSHHVHLQPQHRRTGSSVIETLQTLTCSGAETDKREESIAQFLENLKKEQQEKYEKQELHEMQDELEDLRDCGLAGCRPKMIQGLANIKVFVFLLSMLVTLQQALSSGYLNSVITTIEKRYEIPSSISGIIASMYEIGNVGTVIFVSYLGSRRHIPAWIGMGVLVMGIGSITFSLPHFLSGNYMVHSSNATNDNICKPATTIPQPKSDLVLPGLDKIKSLTEGLSSPPLGPQHNNFNREDNCIEQANESSTMPIFIFMVAQLLLGCGGSPLFTLGTTYIDNHVKRDDSSMYIGIMYSMCAFGPVCGFLLGAYLLSHFVDTFSMIGPLMMDSSDRHWIGMWWGGFLLCGISLILIAIPFFFFPKELKKEKVKVYIDEKYHHATDPSIRPKHKTKPHKPNTKDASSSAPTAAAAAATSADAEADRYGKDIKDIPRSTWKLLTNKIYVVTCLGACMELIIVSGFIVFLPKYLETQFSLSKSEASMFTGGIAIPGACIGIFFGGYILKRLQLRPKGAVQLVIFFNLLCLGCYALLFFFGCDNVKMAGTTMPYFNSNATEPFKINLTASCNFGCECDMNDVQPVCGANGLTYFSPCHAGCTSLSSTSDNFTNCACVLGNHHNEPISNPLHGGAEPDSSDFAEVTMVPVATEGPCYTQCKMISPFMVLLFFMTLVVAVTQMPVLMVVLRSVEEEEKAFALGIQFVIFRLFAYIPSPILFGNVIDSTCLLWKSTCEGEAGGRCLLYDIELFRYKYVGVCCVIKVLSVVIFLLDWWLIRTRQNQEKKQSALTVGEVVNSIISLDKLFEPDGPLWLRMQDPEGENIEVDEEDANIQCLDPPSPRKDASEHTGCLERK